jgi:pseudouridine-5'-phosphate glycosidase
MHGSQDWHPLLAPSAEVRAARAAGRPIVALESTIITHGMPFPENLTTAQSVEATIRAEGAVPATIAVDAGRIVVGVEAALLESLARHSEVVKASRRDLAALLALGRTGGTTVAATMIAAALAGIAVFATGGVGGVHRGAEDTFDISADLHELASTPVTIVCAGVKAILDIGKTLEYLETHGVPVLGFGTDEFPAFYSRTSGHRVDYRIDDAAEVARIVQTQRALGFTGGIMIANPISERDALAFGDIEAHIAQAVADATARGVTRKELTPFLLDRVNELTGGRSLAANVALIRNNARVAAQIALALAGAHG